MMCRMTQMRRPDEIALYGLLRERHGGPYNPRQQEFATHIAAGIGIYEKRATYLLDKWTGRGWWDYGVTLRSGWFTDAAPPLLS